MRISDWSSDVCSSDLAHARRRHLLGLHDRARERRAVGGVDHEAGAILDALPGAIGEEDLPADRDGHATYGAGDVEVPGQVADRRVPVRQGIARSEEHTSELQSLMRISYAVLCLKKQKTN